MLLSRLVVKLALIAPSHRLFCVKPVKTDHAAGLTTSPILQRLKSGLPRARPLPHGQLAFLKRPAAVVPGRP